MQYSGAQNIVPLSKEPILTPDEEPDVQGSGPSVSEPELDEDEPQTQGEEPRFDKDGEPELNGEDDLTSKDDEPKEQATDTGPRKGVEGGLDIVNTTQQSLPPAFKIIIQFEGLSPVYLSGITYNCNLFGCGTPGPKRCADWNLVAYVQGKLVKISEEKHYVGNGKYEPGLEVCNIRLGSGIGISYVHVPPVTVEIPGESVENVRDYRPLSIFTVGWQNDSSTCPPPPLNAPEQLPEVQRIIVDKGLTHSESKEKIANIQHEVQNQLSVGCTPVKPTTTTPGVPTSYLQNQRLDTVNILLPAPGYGMELGTDSPGRGIHVRNCDTPPFCISYFIQCPLCVDVREH